MKAHFYQIENQQSLILIYKSKKDRNCLGSWIIYQTLITPSPPLPLKGKGDQPHERLLQQVRWHPLPRGRSSLAG